MIRAALMFGMIILFLRLTGKRGVRQLSIFELAIILSLGSIAGDPMFTEDLPLVHALVVMTVVIETCLTALITRSTVADVLSTKIVNLNSIKLLFTAAKVMSVRLAVLLKKSLPF